MAAAATTAGALKAFIESLGLSIAAYRDTAPDGTAKPYVSILESISAVPDALEDGHLTTGVENAQVDVWQQYRDPASHAVTESYTLPASIAAGLHGSNLYVDANRPGTIGGKRVYGVLVRNLIRMPAEEEENVVHHVIDLHLMREF